MRDAAADGRRAQAACPSVRAATQVPRATLAELLRPWLGDAGLDADLPMPAMIDVDLTEPGDGAVAAVARARRVRSAPGARVDRSASWLAPVRSFMSTLAGSRAGSCC